MNEFDRSSVGGRVGGFQALAATKKAVCVYAQVFVWNTHHFFWKKCPGAQLAVWCGACMLSF